MRSYYSFYIDACRIALQSIFAHKLRAFLTLIGIIIGVASVVVVGAAISGLNTYIVDKVSKVLGANHFMIARMASEGPMTEEQWEAMNRRNKRLEMGDFEWLREHCTSCTEVGAVSSTQVTIEQDGQQFFGTLVFGVTANMVDIEDKTIVDGRFITPSETQHSAMVVVIGGDIKDKFFPDVDPIGRTLKVAGLPLRVVGVEQKRGMMFGQSFDKHVYIPLTTFGRIFGRRRDLQLHGKSADREQFKLTIEEARTTLRNYHRLLGHKEDDFGLVNVDDLNKQIDQFTGAIALVVTPITLISLVVGGIVVMNIMLVSVTERTFEIGLRKALGARRKQILLQFLIESSILCALGGLLGLGLASGICLLIRATTPIPMTITLLYILLSLLFSGGIGIIAGLYPAFKASRLDPIVALAKN
ncbi:MAG: ABC transporter permease [Pyrinomonadaceae bacterium]|nr:ABC transporter permease [Pyrinomonadaceae bacterium]